MGHGPLVGHDAVFSGPQRFSTINSISTINSKLHVTTFLAFLLANSSMAMSKFILSVNCCSIDSVARFLNRKVIILDLKSEVFNLWAMAQ